MANTDCDNILISSAKKDEELESFVKSKREELKKMIPGFADDEKFNELVLKFYERGIRDGIDFGMARMKQQMMKGAVEGEIVYDDEYLLIVPALSIITKGMDDGDKLKVIFIKED